MMEKLKDFKEYFCRYRCRYRGTGKVNIPMELNGENTYEDFPICRYCKLNDFIEEYKKENY